jgi:small subunit ribosomal protein S24e
MSDGEVTVRTRKFMRNPLLKRRQMVLDVFHPGQGPVAKAELTKMLSKTYKADEQCVYMFHFKTAFGGGRTTGFALIYDSVEDAKKFEPRHRLIRKDLAQPKPASRGRKVLKETKAKVKRTWGTGRRAALHKQKKAG